MFVPYDWLEGLGGGHPGSFAGLQVEPFENSISEWLDCLREAALDSKASI
jgi:hypothetical protein